MAICNAPPASGYNPGAMKLILSAMLVVLGALGGLGLGCSHEAKPAVQPDDHPPLPPASGTPIGLLVDDASELKLRDDQVTKLKAIDDELATRLAALDGALRTPDPVPSSSRPDKPRGLGFRAGGSNGGFGGATGGFPGAPGGGNAPDGAQRAGFISADTITDVNQKRAHELRDAIRRALALLDAEQQTIARRVFTEHAVDPDTGQTGPEPSAANPGEPNPH
jgi:hypothetical protein